MNTYCNLIETQPKVLGNFQAWSKNSKNIYSILLNHTDDYCKAFTATKNSMMEILVNIAEIYVPGVIKTCPLKVVFNFPLKNLSF